MTSKTQPAGLLTLDWNVPLFPPGRLREQSAGIGPRGADRNGHGGSRVGVGGVGGASAAGDQTRNLRHPVEVGQLNIDFGLESLAAIELRR